MIGTEADYAWMRERRIKHGTANAYKYHGCRCDQCREALHKYFNAWRKAKKAEGDKLAKQRAHCDPETFKEGCHCSHCVEIRRENRVIRVTREERMLDSLERSLIRDSTEILRDTVWKYSGTFEKVVSVRESL